MSTQTITRVPRSRSTPSASRCALFAMRDFNKRLSDPKKYQSMMLNTGQGMTVAMKL